MSDRFLKYTRIYGWGWKLLGIITAAYLIVFFAFAFSGADVKYEALPVLVIIILGSLIPAWRQKKFREGLEDIKDELQQDFDNAVDFRGGKLKLGNRWMYIKGKSRIIPYSEVTQVYQHVTRTYFIETERELKYVDSKGRKRTLCKLELRGKSDAEVKHIVGIMWVHNNSIKIGYN